MIYYAKYDVQRPHFTRDEKRSLWSGVAFIAGIACTIFVWRQMQPTKPVEIVSPCATTGCAVTPTPTATPTPSPVAPQRPTTGKASYYSIAGCLGCSPTFTMANGERLDDGRLTLAYNHAPLNSKVTIRNTKTGATVIATITDRGGFERHGKIADLTIATRDALGCGDICPIELVW